jgi:hypothetical protein
MKAVPGGKVPQVGLGSLLNFTATSHPLTPPVLSLTLRDSTSSYKLDFRKVHMYYILHNMLLNPTAPSVILQYHLQPNAHKFPKCG